MKYCSRCDSTKEKTEFGNNKSKKDGLQTFCKQCAAKYANGYYKKGDIKQKHIIAVSERRKGLVKENKKLILDYLNNHPCVDCGETDPIVLEFDHQRDKRMNVSRLVLSGYPEQTILDEIAKCEVRCANCHRRKTARDQDWFKNKA